MEASSRDRGIAVFFAVLLVLAVLRVLIAVTLVPEGLVRPLSVLATIVFVATPIFALFRAASAPWSWQLALVFIVAGAAVQAGCGYLARHVAGTPAAAWLAASQVGLVTWCVGLGALLTTRLKDRNLIIPVTIFLACFDLFLVFTPVGPTRLIMRAMPELLPAVGYGIPKVQATVAESPLTPFALVGPADFIFMAMFFVALYKFDMRPRQTLIALVPTLLGYLLLSGLLGAIPLLPPIAAVVLLVNLPEFKLTREEWMSTAVVAVLGIGLIAWGATRPKPRVEIVPMAPAPGASAPANSRG